MVDGGENMRPKDASVCACDAHIDIRRSASGPRGGRARHCCRSRPRERRGMGSGRHRGTDALIDAIRRDVASVADAWAAASIAFKGLDPGAPSWARRRSSVRTSSSGTSGVFGTHFPTSTITERRESQGGCGRGRTGAGSSWRPPRLAIRPAVLSQCQRGCLDRARADRIGGQLGTQAVAYRALDRTGHVCLVLGAGNTSHGLGRWTFSASCSSRTRR